MTAQPLRGLRGGTAYLEGYGQLWDEMPGGDIPLAHARRHPSYCVDCQVAQYCNVVKTRASFVEGHQKDGHRVFDPLIDYDPAPNEGGAVTTATVSHVQLLEVDLDQIDANPWQPRTSMDVVNLIELQNDIMSVGLLQEPMARQVEGRYQLAFGHRRIEALRGLSACGKWGTTATIKVQPLTDQQMAYIALAENRAREDLTPAEEIRAWAKVLREIEGVTIQSLADAVGVDRTTMSKNLSILNLPPTVLELVHAGKMSLRAARELLCLRNDDHCHEDMIAMVLRDLAGGSYQNALPDYRLKTVRRSIRGLAGGNPAHGGANGFYDAQRSWRPLERTFGRGGRGVITFDTGFFKTEHPHQVHVLPEGEESGGTEWTCAVRQWATWSSRATREANKAGEAEGSAASSSGASIPSRVEEAEEWWKAVKRDPVVKDVVGKRLRAMKSHRDLTEEDLALLGTRVRYPKGDTVQLPQEAQPEGVKLGANDGASVLPFFEYGQCATCVDGASWVVPSQWDTPRTPRLVCANKQAWMDKRSVAMQQWADWKETQILLDYQADVLAIGRLSLADPLDAAVVVRAMLDWFLGHHPVQPMSRAGLGWDERTRHNYWPAGATEFAALTALNLPDATGDWRSEQRWREELHEWAKASAADPGDVLWRMALACLQVWQARVVLGLGADIWSAVAPATGAETETAFPASAAWEPSPYEEAIAP